MTISCHFQNHPLPVASKVCFLSKLPEDLIFKIMAYLKKFPIQVFVLSNQHLSRIAINAAKYNEPMLIKNFFESPIRNLREVGAFTEHSKKLKELSECTIDAPCRNLIDLKDHIIRLKLGIIEVLKEIDFNTLEKIFKDSHPSNFFEHLLYEVDFEKQGGMEEFHQMVTFPAHNDFFLFSPFLSTICKMKRFDLALELAKVIPNQRAKEVAFNLLIEELLSSSSQIQALQQALAIYYHIDSFEIQESVLARIIDRLCTWDSLEEMIHITLTARIEPVFLKKPLDIIYHRLLEAGELAKAKEILEQRILS
ncbi:MAG: hypothetical protein EBZ47_04910 [Chlamydiae bacterium]|nr:hypothetical protein [Chlamydiota bacterium]